MKVFVNIGPYWKPGLTMNAAFEELIRQGKKVDRRTLSAAKEGRLSKCEMVTLLHLRDFASQLAGRQLTFEDLFSVVED